MRRHAQDGLMTITGVPLGLLSLQGCEHAASTVAQGIAIGVGIQLVVWIARKNYEKYMEKKRKSE